MLKFNEINAFSLIRIGEDEWQLGEKQLSGKREMINFKKLKRVIFEEHYKLLKI